MIGGSRRRPRKSPGISAEASSLLDLYSRKPPGDVQGLLHNQLIHGISVPDQTNLRAGGRRGRRLIKAVLTAGA